LPARLIKAILPEGGQLASIDRILELTRQHLDMDLMILGEFVDGQRVMRNVVGVDPDLADLAGSSEPRDTTYCGLAADGRIGAVVPDTLDNELTSGLRVTRDLGVRSYVGVPIALSNGEVYGTLCCFGREPNHEVSPTQLGLLAVVSGLIAQRIEDERATELRTTAARTQIRQLVDDGQPRMVFQPIVDLRSGLVSGVEALARFDTEPPKPPDAWFAAAAEAGCGPELEVAAIRAALRWLPDIPASQCMFVNVGAAALGDPEVQDELLEAPLDRITIEVTEQNLLEHPDESRRFIARARELGTRIAIDDLGAGYAGLHRVLELSPDVIKLDRQLVSGIDQDPARFALVGATAAFATSIGSEVVAEGVEHEAELRTLQGIGVSHAQGYHLGHPVTAPWLRSGPEVPVIAPRSDQPSRQPSSASS
jgi:EAL domain-containing protein (putative c-di-GMP-specific phosphodiesterase class I)